MAKKSTPDTLKVTLERKRMWVPEGATKADSYGPGEVEIPYAMAEGLVRAGELKADVLPVPLEEQPHAATEVAKGGAVSDLYGIVDSLHERVKVLEEALVPLLEKSVGPTMDYSGLNITDEAFAFAMENDLDSGVISGTGKDGRITKGDVEAALKASKGD